MSYEEIMKTGTQNETRNALIDIILGAHLSLSTVARALPQLAARTRSRSYSESTCAWPWRMRQSLVVLFASIARGAGYDPTVPTKYCPL